MKAILEIKDLSIKYEARDGDVHAVNHLDLVVKKGESLGLVGETGAGKTTTSLGILNLVPSPPGKIVSGEIIYEDENLLKASKSKMRHIRGGEISMIFQDPMTSLNPVETIGFQITEVIRIHEKVSAAEATKKAVDMLKMVGIDPKRFDDYPHQFSGGMKQRVVIAMALVCNPKLLIADEPTTALDVTIQAQMLDLMNELKNKFDTSLLLITHDLGVVAEVCDSVAIMYAGEVVEYGTIEDIFNDAQHPYTIGLFNSIPSLTEKKRRLESISGMMPDMRELPIGCKFADRCPYAKDECRKGPIAKEKRSDTHEVRCILNPKEEVGA